MARGSLDTMRTRRGPIGISRRAFLETLGAAGAGSLGLTGYGFAIEPGWRLDVTRYRLAPPKWPADLRLSIAVVADIHAGGRGMQADRVAAIAERTNALRPDLIVLLGDFVASQGMRTHKMTPREWSAPLDILKAPLGVHAILGNHDWWEDADAQDAGRGPTRVRRTLERMGIPVYENDAVRLVHDGRPFWLAGLGDQLALRYRCGTSGRRCYRGVDDLDGTLAEVGDSAPVILLAHEPDVFPRVPSRVSLTLSGHTHGGQVRLFGYSPVVRSRYGNRYAYGHVVEGGRHMVVSGGLGCSILPVRIGVPPEIVMVDVVGQSATA
jgi:predicted MPP superfamily phosphohydrolase